MPRGSKKRLFVGQLIALAEGDMFKPYPHLSKQPYPCEQRPDCQEEQQPHLPPNSRPLGHSQHPIHCPSQPQLGIFERLVHLFSKGRGVADLITHGDSKGLELRNFGKEDVFLGSVLGFEAVKDGGRILASETRESQPDL